MTDGTDQAKQSAAKHALAFVKDGMLLGLGSGSTAAYFIKNLLMALNQGLRLEGVVASSKQSADMIPSNANVKLLSPQDILSLDLTVDGADAIDPNKNLIKGAGGALFREKILASMSHSLIIIADENKCVSSLQRQTLPIEISPFGCLATLQEIKKLLPTTGSWRSSREKIHFITDNGNYIYDAHLETSQDLKTLHNLLIQIPGVVETGLFFGLAGQIIIGYTNNSVRMIA